MDLENFSYSKLDTYTQCPFKFKLKYIDGFYFYADSINTEIGTAVHKCEEQIAKDIQAQRNIDYIKYKNELLLVLAELKYKYPTEFFNLDKSGRTFEQKIYEYLNYGIYKLEQYMKDHPTYKIVGIEQPFKVVYKSGQNLNGFIDRIFYDEVSHKYIIQDIKTYAVPIETEKLTTPLQFVVYTYAVQDLYKCKLSQIICQYYLPFCSITQTACTTGYLSRGEAKIDKIFINIAEQNFEPKPTPLCNWCEYAATNPDAGEESKFKCPYFCYWDRNTRNSKDITKLENKWQGLEQHNKIMENYLTKHNLNKKEVN